jgi:hypothetical protein
MGAAARESALDVGWDGIVAAVEERMRAAIGGSQPRPIAATEPGMAPV